MTPTSVAAYAAPAPTAPLERITIPRREPGAHDILIDIKYAGICHSDIHTVRAEWGDGGTFPIVPGKKVAVVGLGGLGHMGVKIAAAMGAEVTVLSQSLRKKDDGLRLGADHYYATSAPATFEELAGSFDLILNTVSANLDLNAYFGLLRTDGTLVQLGAPENPLPIAPFALIQHRKSFAGSMIDDIPETQEMLDFCGVHGLAADFEVISADRINEAYERVLASDVRYRFVIDTSTI
ncbi:zinc-binding dehydrogenase [Streptomyces inhibens]|uniref:zinc-binding dehydrogenase n=1 Tax=Streptomyces inhibens TaxID=2293571 RepID=UPI00402ABA4B